jgi:hypothetical protein
MIVAEKGNRKSAMRSVARSRGLANLRLQVLAFRFASPQALCYCLLRRLDLLGKS